MHKLSVYSNCHSPCQLAVLATSPDHCLPFGSSNRVRSFVITNSVRGGKPSRVNDSVETNVQSMRLINEKTFLERESLIRDREPVDRHTEVLEFDDDEATEYAPLSHR